MQLRTRELLIILLLMALPVASYFMVFKPKQQRVAEARADIAAKRQKLADLNAAVAGNKDLPTEIDKLKKAIAFIDSKLPEKKEMDKVLEEIWRIAKKDGLDTKAVRSMAAIPGNNYSEQPIRVIFVGPFLGFYQFLNDVEGLPRITRVNDLIMKKDEKSSGNIKVEFTLSIYFERDQGAVAGIQ